MSKKEKNFEEEKKIQILKYPFIPEKKIGSHVWALLNVLCVQYFFAYVICKQRERKPRRLGHVMLC